MTGKPLPTPSIGWPGIARLGLVQMMLGAIIVLATTTLNRVMVVELALPAIVPGLLIGLHYALQLMRPRLGFAADRGGHVRWIIGGMAMMVAGVMLAAIGAALIPRAMLPGLATAAAGYALVGLGVSATGTSLLTVLAGRVAPSRRGAAATVVWLMMIAGSALTAGLVAHLLQPFSFGRLVTVVTEVAGIALLVTLLAVWRLAPAGQARTAPAPIAPARTSFGAALTDVWRDRDARRFAGFVFVSMLAYSGQELILEPFAGLVFSQSPAATARLSALQHGGVLAGMLLVALAGSLIAGRLRSMQAWTVGGCLGSATCLVGLAVAGRIGPGWPLHPTVFLLGVANGVFAVSAIGAMLQLSSHRSEAGTRMGLWGAAQAVAFGAGGLISTGGSDLARHLLGSPQAAYAAVFGAEAGLFLVAAWLATSIFAADRPALLPHAPAAHAPAAHALGSTP